MGEARRKAGRRLAGVVLGLALGVVGAEGLYRLTRSGELGPTTNPGYVLHDSELGWAYRPGARARHRTDEFDVGVRINSGGFRGAEWPPPRAGRRRVLVLGDSFAFGWGVDEDRTLAALIDAAEPAWDVLNAGVSGYGTDQELLLLRRLMREARPDLVVCLLCANDLYECAGRVAYGKRKPAFELADGRLVATGVPVPQPLLERVSHLWRALEKHTWERRHARRRAESAAEWRLVEALLDEMSRELSDVPLVIASERDELEAFAAARAGVHHVDLRPALAASEEPVTYAADGHWTAAGHAAVARALRERIAALLP